MIHDIKRGSVSRTLKTFSMGLILLLLFSMSTDALAQRVEARKTRINITNGKSSYHWSNGRYSLKVESRGEIEWSINDDDVGFISRGGYIEIEEKDRGYSHRVLIEPMSNGQLEYTYRRDGRKRSFDEEGKEWLAEVLPQFIRNSGIGAEERTQRILRTDGVDGVLAEIELIDSPSSKSKYLGYLFEFASLDAGQTRRAAQLTSEISSPGDKTRVLMAGAKDFFRYESSLDAYFDALESVSSPGDKTRALIHLAEENLLAEKTAYMEALDVALTISSPGDKSRFLMKAAPMYMATASTAYFDVVNTISSPGDHARVLINLMDEQRLDATSAERLMRSAERISSPGDKARVIIAGIRQLDGLDNDSVIEVLLDASETISSPGDRSRVLIALLDEVKLSKSSMYALLDAARTISSPGDKTRVLLRAADQVDEDDELVEAYLEVAETISSPGDRKRALEALLK